MRERHHTRVVGALLTLGLCLGIGLSECRAGSIQNIIDNDGGVITSGKLTFTFTNASVANDPANPPANVIFTPPTAATIDVTVVAGGLTFSFNPFLSLTTALAITQKVTISYTVAAGGGISGAGLAFSGLAVDINTGSDLTETFTGRNETLNVFSNKDNGGAVTSQNNQSVLFNNNPLTLSVVNTGTLTTGVRGNGAQSTAQLSEITNTFSVVPEPASLGGASIGALLFLTMYYRRSEQKTARLAAN